MEEITNFDTKTDGIKHVYSSENYITLTVFLTLKKITI